MQRFVLAALSSALIPLVTLGAVTLAPLPRATVGNFVSEGLFTGGRPIKAELRDLRVGYHSAESERWVFDFGSLLPHCQVHYEPAVRDGAKARFIIRFQKIYRNTLSESKVRLLAAKSHHVQSVNLYPPVENGDIALELILKHEVQFAPYQPIDLPGRLVLDLRPKH
jgi:hypothetical protein